MKKLLIIQTSGPYFLFETLETLMALDESLKSYDLHLLMNEKSLKQLPSTKHQKFLDHSISLEEAQKMDFDISVNLSLEEDSWSLQEKIKATKKLGPAFSEGRVVVPDLWSSFHLTLKSNTPFLTFHLQDLYRNILGVPKRPAKKLSSKQPTVLVIGLFNPDYFPAKELEDFTNGLQRRFPHLEQKDVSEISENQNLDHVLYVGPPHLDALKLCSSGAKGIFVTARFQGLNLLPYQEGHELITTQERGIASQELLPIVSHLVKNEEIPTSSKFGVYKIDQELFYGAYLFNKHGEDRAYPVYQAQVVLWNFLLNLIDIDPSIRALSADQAEVIDSQMEIVTKLTRLHDYALSSLKTIHQEAKAQEAKQDIIQGHLKNLKDMEHTFDLISQGQPLLRALIDFYRIRKGQNEGQTLLQQTQNSIITYTEEHQALEAYGELLKGLRSKK